MPNAVTINIELARPIPSRAGDPIITNITLRSPTLSELIELGVAIERRDFAGGFYFFENNETIARYFERCLLVTDAEDAPIIIEGLGLKDALRARDALLSLWISAHSAAMKTPFLPTDLRTAL